MWIGLVVLAGGAAVIWWFSVGSSATSSSTISSGMEQRGGSGIAERIFFAIFGAPRDIEKEESTLSWQKKPVIPRPTHRDGFSGRGASGRW